MDFEAPAISHDGAHVAYLRTEKGSPAAPTDIEVWVAGIDGANPRRLAADWDRWATSIEFAADDAALIATADSDGRGPIYRLPLDGRRPSSSRTTTSRTRTSRSTARRATSSRCARTGSRRRTRCASRATAP